MKTMKRLSAAVLALAMSVSAMAVSAAAEEETTLATTGETTVESSDETAASSDETAETTSDDTVASSDETAETASDDTAAQSAGVYVTIHDKDGDIALANTYLDVTDTDGDGALTIVDALYTAHDRFYEGGADAGFAVAESDWGTSLAKLWGEENGGSYGYYVNDASAWSMKDTIKDGDFVSAFVYTDLSGWSDKYAYFDKHTGEINADNGETLELTLSYIDYDENYNPVVVPCEGAYIVLNGEKTGFVTDKDGKVTVDFMIGGDYIVSAVSDDVNLVSPVLTLSVLKTDEEEPEEETEEPEEEPTIDENEEEAADDTKTTDSAATTTSNPKTSSELQLSLAGLALVGVVAAKRKRK